MANRDNPHGLQSIGRTLSGGEPVLEEYKKLAATATAIFVNDVVNRGPSNDILPGGVPGTTLYEGVSLGYGPALTETRHMVVVSPDALYLAQDDGDVDGTVELDLGLNANLVFGAGNPNTFISGHEIDASTAAITATLDVKLWKLHQRADNEFGVNADVVVVFNKHRLAVGQAGI